MYDTHVNLFDRADKMQNPHHPGVQSKEGTYVVVSDVLPYTIVGDNPAKVIRQRFADEIITALLEIAI